MKLKKGLYYIGDPCYIFDKSWDKVLKQTDYFENTDNLLFGESFAGGGTAHGDGSYYDNYDNEYFVDAGLLSCLPVSLLEIDKVYTIEDVQKGEGFHIIEFKEDFEAYCDNGYFEFGHISIETDYTDDE
jgi:hypothetical protein